jgi:hypothetical protein
MAREDAFCILSSCWHTVKLLMVSRLVTNSSCGGLEGSCAQREGQMVLKKEREESFVGVHVPFHSLPHEPAIVLEHPWTPYPTPHSFSPSLSDLAVLSMPLWLSIGDLTPSDSPLNSESSPAVLGGNPDRTQLSACCGCLSRHTD